MDIKHLLARIDSIGEAANPAQQAAIAINKKKHGDKPKTEGTMASAETHATGPKFVGKWKGTDSAAKARSKYVGAAESRNLLQDLESKLNETPVRDIMAEFREFKKLSEFAPKQSASESTEPGVTEDLDEVAMNPTAFAQAIKTGQDKGVLVGFEFETCIPQASVQQWKTGDAPPETPAYDPESTTWIEGKTVADLVGGVASKANGNLGNIMVDLFKNKGSVAAQLGYKSPWDGYRRWVGQQIRERMASENNTKVVFEKLAELLKDPEVATMPIEYGYSSEREGYGPSSNWNGRTFTIEIL